MITRGQAISLKSNINSVIALMFVGSFALMCGLMVWNSAFGENPVEKIFLAAAAKEVELN